MKELQFRSGGGGSFKQTPDSLLTNDTVEVLLGLSEGPIKGPVNGPKSFYADGTQIVNDNGEPNFSSFNLMFWPGSESDTVTMALGGFASPVQINTTLAHAVPIVRQGQQTHITAVDFRIILQQLYKQDTKGVYADTLQLKFEFKPVSQSVWLPCFSSPPASSTDFSSPNGQNSEWNVNDFTSQVNSFFGDRTVTRSTVAPPPTPTAPALAVVDPAHVYSWDTNALQWYQAATTAGAGNSVTFQDTVGNQTVTRTYFHNQTGTPTANEVGDIWDTGTGILMWNGSAWVTPGAYDASQYQPDPVYLDNGVWSWKGKVSSSTPINVRVYVPDIGEPYDFRVTKLTTDSTTDQFSVVSWESLEEIKQSSWTFHDLSMLKVLGRASDQFTALPQWETDAEGRIVKVPTNYDAEARTYTGVWDGTYKLAYTNNPAWVFLDFIENTSYGLSSVYPHVANKWSIYDWAQHCDEAVPTSTGGTQPRWTFNDWITQPRDAKEMAQYIAGAAGALYVDDGNGLVEVMVDKDASAVALFTPENVTIDGFSYSYTDRLTRANEVIVSFANPLLNGATDKRRVTNDDDIASVGRISDDFIAVGCYDVDEALRRGRRRLISGLTEKEFVSFVTNRKGKFLRLWDVILVSDPDMGRGESGRIVAKTGANSVSLRDPITLESGFTYKAIFEVPNTALATPFQTIELDVSTAAGSHTSLTFAQNLPAGLPEYAVFSLECQQTVGLPKPYRVLSIEDDASNGELIRITALELNRNKYTYIDTTEDLGSVDYSNFYGQNIEPPANPKVTVYYRLVGNTSDRVLTLSWDASPSPLVKQYEVSWLIDGTPAGTATTNTLSIDVTGANRGVYTFSIVAVGANGKRSAPIGLIYDTVGNARVVPSPKNLRLTNGYSSTEFSTTDAVFSWDPADSDPNFSHYHVEVLATDGTTVLRSTTVGTNLTWTYDFPSNKADGGGTPNREFEVGVAAVDQDGNASPFVTLTVNNPAPALSTAVIEVNPYVLHFHFTPPADLDYAGIAVWMSDTSGFTPGPSNLVHSDKGNPSLSIHPGHTYYIRYAFYDVFGMTGLHVSSEEGISTPKVDFNDIDNIAAQISAAVDAINNDIATDVTLLKKDVTEAFRQVGLAGYDLIRGAINLSQIKSYLDSLAYIDGEPIGSFTLNQVTRTDDLYSTFNLMGVKAEDGSAFILHTQQVMIDATGATIAATLDQLNATDATNAANIVTESVVRASGDSALAATISSLTVVVNNNTAAITTEQSVRASADSALASSISVVSANLGTVSAQVTVNANAIATVTGQLYGTYGIRVRAGNVVTGLTLYASGGATNFSGVVFDADYLQIKSSSFPTVTPFSYDATSGTLFLENITVRNANIQEAAIDTLQIAGNAVSGVSAASVSSNSALSSSEQTDLFLGYTSGGGKICVTVYGEIATNSSADPAGAVIKVYVDGTEIGHGNVYCPGKWGGTGVGFPAMVDASAGGHSITVTYQSTPGSSPSVINRTTILVTELKR